METRKDNATVQGGEVAGSHANAKSTGDDCTTTCKQFNAGELAALRIEIDWIIAEYPDLGREGFAIRYIAPAVDREYLESEMFTVEVAKGLQLLAIQRVGVQPLCHSEEISSQFKICTAAAIIACSIAEYRVNRIEGQRHAEILRAKRKGQHHG